MQRKRRAGVVLVAHAHEAGVIACECLVARDEDASSLRITRASGYGASAENASRTGAVENGVHACHLEHPPVARQRRDEPASAPSPASRPPSSVATSSMGRRSSDCAPSRGVTSRPGRRSSSSLIVVALGHAAKRAAAPAYPTAGGGRRRRARRCRTRGRRSPRVRLAAESSHSAARPGRRRRGASPRAGVRSRWRRIVAPDLQDRLAEARGQLEALRRCVVARRTWPAGRRARDSARRSRRRREPAPDGLEHGRAGRDLLLDAADQLG